MKKKLLFVLLVGLFMMPLNVFAFTADEAKVIFEKISTTTDAEGNATLELNYLSPEVLLDEGVCSFTKESIMEECPSCFEDYTDEDWESVLEERTTTCSYDLITALFEMHMMKVGVKLEKGIDVWVEDGLVVVGIQTGFDDNGEPIRIHKDYRVTYALDNHADMDDAFDVANEFENTYIMSGLSVFNSVYHYGSMEDNMYSSLQTLHLFEEAKLILESHPEFEYRAVLRGGGASEFGTGATLVLGIFKDDSLLAVKYINLAMFNILTVDKEGTESPFDKGVKVLSDYFNNKATIKVNEDSKVILDDDYARDSFNEYFDTVDQDYIGYFAIFMINGKEQPVLIVELDNEDLIEDELLVSAIDTTNGVLIETDSFEVPVDVVLETEDVTKGDIATKAAKKNNKKFSKVLDISLIAKNSGKKISNISKGVTLYIELGDEYKDKEKIDVFYINDDGIIEETLEAQVIKKDNKLYAQMVVYHFSVYAIEAESTVIGQDSTAAPIPETGDGIMVSIVALGLSLIGIYFVKKYEGKA